jgi:hypothetical protein
MSAEISLGFFVSTFHYSLREELRTVHNTCKTNMRIETNSVNSGKGGFGFNAETLAIV